MVIGMRCCHTYLISYRFSYSSNFLSKKILTGFSSAWSGIFKTVIIKYVYISVLYFDKNMYFI